ncbi:MAG TPA: tripartite tricarboxylate transporter substrate binding protein [Burkholderiales bacterium]|nr:tripartite tricarboxylate transporter substrate binding protein [Burkholderiales bacterium]
MKMQSYSMPFALLLGLLAALPSHAQNFPTHPVRILVPLSAGGGMDAVARGLAQKLGDAFGQTVVVDNRPGAGSAVALEILSAAAPDGHTLMMSSTTPIIHPLLYKSRFDLARDFAPVSQVTAQGYVLTVHPAIPAKSVLELVQHLKANPGKLNFASSGIGSPIHMAGELFQIATGTKMIHIPYKGMGAAYTDMVGGRVQIGFPTIISSTPHIQAGRLRPLAVTPAKRVAAVPDIPTFAEAGVKGVVVVNWYGLVAPLRTPKPIIDRIAKETNTAMHSAEITKRLAAEGSDPVGSSPSEFAAHIRSEQELWSRVIKQAGIRGE